MQLFIEDELPLSLCYERSWSAIENHLMAFDRNHHRSKAEGSWPVTSVWASFAAVRKYLLEASDRRCRCGSLETIHGILWSVVLNGCWFQSASSPKKKKKKKKRLVGTKEQGYSSSKRRPKGSTLKSCWWVKFPKRPWSIFNLFFFFRCPSKYQILRISTIECMITIGERWPDFLK